MFYNPFKLVRALFCRLHAFVNLPENKVLLNKICWRNLNSNKNFFQWSCVRHLIIWFFNDLWFLRHIKTRLKTLSFKFYSTGKVHAPVKRHHSAGDMLDGLDLDSAPEGHRSERPRSEGHRYMAQFSPKRTTSYGVICVSVIFIVSALVVLKITLQSVLNLVLTKTWFLQIFCPHDIGLLLKISPEVMYWAWWI